MAESSQSATPMVASASTRISHFESSTNDVSSPKEGQNECTAAKPLRNNHKCSVAGFCEHGLCKRSYYISRREERYEKFRCEDGRGHPTNLNKPCKGVAKIECGLCRGLVCRVCYDVHSPHSNRLWNPNDNRSDRRRV